MIYATTMADGTLALTEVVPSAVIIDGARHPVLGTCMIAGRVGLRTEGGVVATAAASMRELTAGSVPGALLEFPTQADEIGKWHPDRQAMIATAHGAVDHTAIPADRSFRNAWRHDGASLSVDMPAARGIHRDRMRAARAPLLAALDVAYQRADEKGDAAAKAVVADRKQALRDVTADAAIDAATTPDELVAVWPVILGDPRAA